MILQQVKLCGRPKRLDASARYGPSMHEPVAELRYEGEISVHPYRRGTYLGGTHLEELIERTLGARYSFGAGWRGRAVVRIELYERTTDADAAAQGA
jgi:hypothetical protein